jgi:hypothetical protein
MTPASSWSISGTDPNEAVADYTDTIKFGERGTTALGCSI